MLRARICLASYESEASRLLCKVLGLAAHPRAPNRRFGLSLAGRTCVMFAKWTEARTQELHRLCPLFADRTQEDGKQTGRGQAHIPASHALTGQLLRLQWLMARLQPP